MVNRALPHLLEVRGRGMMRGIRFADPKRAAAITERAFRNGLIIERSGPQDEVVKCLMPLTIDDAVLDEGLDVLAHSLDEEFGRGCRSYGHSQSVIAAANLQERHVLDNISERG